MSRSKHHDTTETKTETESPAAGEGAPPAAAPADAVPPAATQSAAESANLKSPEGGGTDPAAQAKISAQAGIKSGDLASELGALPNIPALDGIKANARAGYYKSVPAEQLAADLGAVSFESEEHAKIRDALVERAKGGAFSK